MTDLSRQLSDNQIVSHGQEHQKTDLKNKKSSILSSCRICLSTLFDPASLSCGHSFCERCLDKYWHIHEKPEYIVCPLCRTSAGIVDFAKKEAVLSTRDFRKMFGSDCLPLELQNPDFTGNATLLCLKISIIVPALYFMLKLLKPAVIDLLLFILSKIDHKLYMNS